MLTQAFHTYRINLSPFTKDFRVWGACIENSNIYLRLSVDSSLKMKLCHVSHCHCIADCYLVNWDCAMDTPYTFPYPCLKFKQLLSRLNMRIMSTAIPC